MPRYLRVTCPCGRALRARPEQAGSTIRCWDCGGQAAVPYPHLGGRVARAYADAFGRTRSGRSVGPTLLGALAITAALTVPVAGPWLGLAGLVAVVALWYGPMVREAGRDLCEPHDHLWGDVRDNNPADDPRLLDTEEIAALLRERMETPPSLARRMAGGLGRIALGVLAVGALVGPVVVRNGGVTLPVDGGWGLRGMLLAMAAWAVVPLVLLVAYARDRRGRLPVQRSLMALVRHPFATLTALLALPVGLALIEGVLALVAWDGNFLAVMTADFSPPPRVTGTTDGTHLHFNYDGRQIERNLSVGTSAVVSVYPIALAHGYSLIGNLPLSLSTGLAVRMNPPAFSAAPIEYFIMRLVLMTALLTLLGLLLALQARWLAVTVSLGARRPQVLATPASHRRREVSPVSSAQVRIDPAPVSVFDAPTEVDSEPLPVTGSSDELPALASPEDEPATPATADQLISMSA